VDEIRQIAALGPELDFLALTAAAGESGNVRDKVGRWAKAGLIIPVAKGIYVAAEELRRVPFRREVLANMLYGPSYISLEYALAANGLIPESVPVVTSVTTKRNKDFDTKLGRFSYRALPRVAYVFGSVRVEIEAGRGYLMAAPEKALLDSLYRSGAFRSVAELERRLFEDFRIDEERLKSLEKGRLYDWAMRMPGVSFQTHFIAWWKRFYS
jgi:hypothetical protein